MNKEDILQTLLANRFHKTDEELERFSEALEQLSQIKADVDFVVQLLSVFTMKAEVIDAMGELEEYMVSELDQAILMEALLISTGQIDNEWCQILLHVLLAQGDNRENLRANYEKLPEDAKAHVLEIFKQLLEKEEEGREDIVSIKGNIRFILGQ